MYGLKKQHSVRGSCLRRCMAILLLCCTTSSSLSAVLKPEDVGAGDVYHLIFTTAGQRDAASDVLAEYQEFVTGEAQLSDLTKDVEWLPLVSVATPSDSSIDARSFIEISGPIYNLNGELFSDVGLFSDDLDAPVTPLAAPNYDQFGQELNVSWAVATGTRTDGTGQDPLGGNFVTVATNNNWFRNGWLIADDEPDTQLYHFYAVSEPIVGVPEPSTAVLGGMLVLSTLIAFSKRRSSKRRVVR